MRAISMFSCKSLIKKITLKSIEEDADYISFVGKKERQDIEKLFKRLFSSEDGRQAIAYLQSITFYRAHAPDIDRRALYYYEGQRALMATILRLTNN